jgi:predicted Ser/Thr protein kinase
MESGKRVGSYVIEEPVGRGGMGVVYRGRHATLPRAVAIKSISPRGTHDLRRLRHRFEREAFVQAQLDHPAIVKVYDYVVSEQTYFIVMEFVEGRSLAQLLAAEPVPLDTARALRLFEQILEAVSYAHTFVYRDEHGAEHRGIVHRDLKPANIMIAPGDRIKITDFGIVKLVGAAATDTSNIVYGSPRYISPEQAAGESLDQRSDIYSLGVILYEMLAGETPFGGRPGAPDRPSRTDILRAHREEQPRPPSALNPSLAPELERVVLRALEKKPERRYASAADFLRALRQARGHAPEAATVTADGHVAAQGGGTAALGATTDELLQDVYHTQEMESGVGPADGDGGATSATGKIMRAEATARQATRRGLRLFGIAAVLLALLAALVAFVRLRGFDARTETKAPPAADASPTPAPTPAPTPPAVAKLPGRARVDSSFDGYDAGPLTDGVTDVRQVAALRYNRANWVSAEQPVEHWIEYELERPSRVTSVYVYWGFDRDRYMPSRAAELQVPDGAGWRTLARLAPAGHYDRTAFEFEPVTAARLRVLQPPGQGPPNRPFLMWVRELEVFGQAE